MTSKGMSLPNNPVVGGTGGAFLTQKGEKYQDVKHEINELEQLLAAAGQTSQSTLLLKKKKEMREVDESLELMKKDHKRRMDTCEERRIRFEEKQAKMREQVLKFEKFIQENDAKRQRAEIKAKQERKLFEEKVKEIQSLHEEIKRLEYEQKHLVEELEKKNGYKSFLERIVEDGEYGYEEVSEVLNRYHTLKQANSDLQAQSTKLENDVDHITVALQTLRTEKQNQVLVNTSVVQELQGELEKKRLTQKMVEEDNVLRIDKKKGVSREFTQIIQAIRNLYLRCMTTMTAKTTLAVHKDTTNLMDVLDANLDIIQSRIVDLIEISDEYHNEGVITASSNSMNHPLNNAIDLKEVSITSNIPTSKSQVNSLPSSNERPKR